VPPTWSLQSTPYVRLYLVATAFSLLLALLAWRRRALLLGRILFHLLLAITAWTATTTVEMATVELPIKIALAVLEYAAFHYVIVLMVIFASRYAERGHWITRRNVALLWVLPAINVAMAATNAWHHLVWSGFDPGPEGSNLIIYQHGLWYWVVVATVYAYNLAAALLLAKQARGPATLARRQARTIILGILAPWVAHLVYILANPVPGLSLTELAFIVTGMVGLLSFERYGLLDLAPIAREMLIDTMDDGVLVVDARGRVIDHNRAAANILSQAMELPAMFVGRAFSERIGPWPAWKAAYRSSVKTSLEITLGHGLAQRYYHLSILPVCSLPEQIAGYLTLFHDMTAHRRVEREREALIVQLQDAVNNVKTLRGLVPICSVCKKIRDDSGYWQAVEQYVSEHSEAEFTHGICPDCMKKYYADYMESEAEPSASH